MNSGKIKKNKKFWRTTLSVMQERGFTLVETMVAIAILLLAILGPLSIASNSLNSAYYARDQVTGYYLAQEGIEYVRYLRDTNTLSGNTWDAGFTNSPGNSKCQSSPCGFNPSTIYPDGTSLYAGSNCTAQSCPVQYDGTNQIYLQSDPNSSFTPTNFNRYIYITPVTADEYKVSVLVTWTTGNISSPKTFSISEDIFNWQQ